MPKANLRQIRGGVPFQEFECSVCKRRITRKCADLTGEKMLSVHKAAIFKEWDAHLYSAHRRQWDALQAKRVKREAKQK